MRYQYSRAIGYSIINFSWICTSFHPRNTCKQSFEFYFSNLLIDSFSWLRVTFILQYFILNVTVPNFVETLDQFALCQDTTLLVWSKKGNKFYHTCVTQKF